MFAPATTSPTVRAQRVGRTGLLWILALLLTCVALPNRADAQVTGISYTLSPVAKYTFWDPAAGLDDGALYGGELGLGFGEYIELTGLYMIGNNLETDFSDFSAEDEAVQMAIRDLAPREIDVRQYGGLLRFNLSRSNIVPFISAGTGVLELDPTDLDASRQIYLTGGLGVTFSLADRYTLSISGNSLAYRYNPASLFTDADLEAVGLSRANFEQELVNNFTVSAALKFYLGGRPAGQLTDIDQALLSQFEPGNIRLVLEPFYGQVNFNEALGFVDSRVLVGLNAGIDLGPYLGVRAFYWRNTGQEEAFRDGVPDDLADPTFYGGELNLRFRNQIGRGILPYLIIGAGYMDINEDSDFRDVTGFVPESRYFATGGLGLKIPLSDALTIQGGARSLFMSRQDIDDLSSSQDVYGSLMYTVGLTFGLGGGGGTTAGNVIGARLESVREAGQAREDSLTARIVRLQDRLASLEEEQAEQGARQDSLLQMQRMTAVQVDSLGRPVALPDSVQQMLRQQGAMAAQESQPAQQRSNLSERSLNVPIPETGEIYLRYGDLPAPANTNPLVVAPDGTVMPASSTRTDSLGRPVGGSGLTAGQVRQIISEEMRRMQPAESSVSPALQQRLNALQQQVESLQQQERRLNELENDLERRTRALEDDIDDRPATPTTQVVTTTGSGGPGLFTRSSLQGVLPTLGARLSGDSDIDNAFLIGARSAFSLPGRPLRVQPEFFLGIGNNISFDVGINGVVPFSVGGLQPYAGGGIGLVSESGFSGLDLVLNLIVGAEYPLEVGEVFVEYGTQDFFTYHRPLAGFRISF